MRPAVASPRPTRGGIEDPDGQILAMHLIEEIHERLPDTHLVMHGSSSVPASLIDRINAAGGMRQIVAERMRQFGQAGHASSYAPLTLEPIRERYLAVGAAT